MWNLDKMDIRPYINKADNYRMWIDYLRFNFQYDIEYLENIKTHKHNKFQHLSRLRIYFFKNDNPYMRMITDHNIL